MESYKGWSVSSAMHSTQLFAKELRGLWVFFFYLSLSWTSWWSSWIVK